MRKYDWLKEAVEQVTDACIDWPFGRATEGYGRLRDPETRQSDGAHRVALRLAGRPAPAPGLLALHSCDNRICVNPQHLRWGTHADNSRDMVERGRVRTPQAILTPEQVREIRRLKGVVRNKELAARFGVAQQTITSVWSRHNWKGVA